MRAAIQNHVDRNQPLLYPGLRETQHPKEELSNITGYTPGGGKRQSWVVVTMFELSSFVPFSPGEAGRVSLFDYQSKSPS